METHRCPPYLLALASLLFVGCAAESAPTATNVSEQTSALLEARDGPFFASVQDRRLAVTYREPHDSSFLQCELFQKPKLTLVFVVGETSLSREMTVFCPRSHGDNGGATNTAMFILRADDDAALWDALFPPAPDGTRWYALRVAAQSSFGRWDSRFGADYRLVLEPRAP